MKKKIFFVIFFFVFCSTKIGTVFFSQWRHVLQTGRRQEAPESETYEQKTLRRQDKETKAGKRLQSLLIQGTGELMAKCKIQVTIHTGTIICDALSWRSMSHTADVGLLFGSHGERA